MPAADLPSGPRLLNLELTQRCNLACPMCGRDDGDVYDGRDMSEAVFERLLPLMSSCETVWLSGYGEPLLLPHLADWIRRCKAAGAPITSFTSNGLLLDGERAEALIAAGLDRIQISFEGEGGLGHGAPEGVTARVLENLRALSALRRERGRPDLLLAFVLMRSNLSRLLAVVERAAEFGATTMTVQPFRPARAIHRDENVLRHVEETRPVLEAARRRAVELGVDLKAQFMDFDLGGTPRPCDFPWRFMHVAWDGSVYMCCAGVGTGCNVLEHDPREIWAGASYEELRQRLEEGRLPESCRSCPIVRLDVESLERDLPSPLSWWRKLRRKSPVEVRAALLRRWRGWWRR